MIISRTDKANQVKYGIACDSCGVMLSRAAYSSPDKARTWVRRLERKRAVPEFSNLNRRLMGVPAWSITVDVCANCRNEVPQALFGTTQLRLPNSRTRAYDGELRLSKRAGTLLVQFKLRRFMADPMTCAAHYGIGSEAYLRLPAVNASVPVFSALNALTNNLNRLLTATTPSGDSVFCPPVSCFLTDDQGQVIGPDGLPTTPTEGNASRAVTLPFNRRFFQELASLLAGYGNDLQREAMSMDDLTQQEASKPPQRMLSF